MAGDFTVNPGAARKMLRAPWMQKLVNAAANRGLAEFRRSARRRTGEYAADAHVEEAKGWDGRVAARIVSTAPGSLSQTFGAYGRRGDPAMQSAAAAAGTRPGRGR